MKVLIYPGRAREELGAIRWEVEWDEITSAALIRNKDGDCVEIDPDTDVITVRKYYKTQEAAMRSAELNLKRRSDWLAFGSMYVQKQVVEFIDDESDDRYDHFAKWVDVGDPQHVD